MIAKLLALALLCSPAQDLAQRVGELAHPDPEVVEGARRALAGLEGGERREGALLLLEGFEGASAPERRARAELLIQLADPTLVERVIPLAADPDRLVRALLIDLLARPDLPPASAPARVAALAERAEIDPRSALRSRALEALGELDCSQAVAALARLARSLPPPERARAAASLPTTPRSTRLVAELAAAGFSVDPQARTPDDVLAAVLPLHGRLLADDAEGGERLSDLAPLVLGLSHPSAAVRKGARRAFEELLARLRTLGQAQRADRLLGELASAGIDPRVVHHHRALFALYPGGDPAGAREAARAMRAGRTTRGAGASFVSLSGDELVDGRLWLFRSLYLEGIAELALGRSGAARELLTGAAAVLDATLGERRDRGDDASRLDHVDALHQRALVEVAQALVLLAEGGAPADPSVLEHARATHRLSVEAQGHFARVAGEALTGWDRLFDTELSPYRLLFTGVHLPGLTIERAIELQWELGRALASVAPLELPGFVPAADEPAGELDPSLDPRRRALLDEVQRARLEGVVERIDELSERLANRREPSGELPEEEIAELEALDRRRRLLEGAFATGRPGEDLLELRIPGSQALWLARDLREEGRGIEARRVARRMKEDLEQSGVSNWWYYHGQSLFVRADLLIGSSYTDEDEPRRAEEALLGAVERLEGLERQLTENGARPRDLAPYEALRSTALVSLAVNANVKMGDPERALAYYERAYELRQDEFMTVLLACYRARSGRAAEARHLLREVRPGPQTWYNLACTHALLGETGRALEYLERELLENHSSEASRRRQAEWARGDPDLTNLRGDPRFVELVGER